MGYTMPRGVAQMREVKAEGGWGVVCTGYCSIHPSSDDTPRLTGTLWDAEDVRAQALTVEAVHRHGALAGMELWYGGTGTTAYLTRMPSLGVTSQPLYWNNPLQTRAMDRRDIRDFRRWHRDAARRAREAGFDIIYVYATHEYLQDDFLSRHANRRSDEYGGSLENRARLVRELIEEAREATQGACAIAARFRADEGGGEDAKVEHEDRRELFSLLAELPDLWDISRLRQADDLEARRRCRPFHLARHDGTSDRTRPARHDRRGAALDRRSVPAPEDRRGASR